METIERAERQRRRPLTARAESVWGKTLSRKDEFLVQSLWVFACQMAANFILYLFHVAMGRLLSHADYGELVALLTFIYILSVPFSVLQTITSEATTRALREGRPHDIGKETLQRLLTLLPIAFSIALVALSVQGPLARFLRIERSAVVGLLGAYLALSLYLPVARGVLQGRQNYYQLGLNMVGEALFRLGIGVALVLAGQQLFGALSAYCLAYALAFIWALGAIWPALSRHSSGVRFQISLLVNPYSLPVLIISTRTMAMVNVDILAVKHFCSPTVAGLYASAAMLGKVILLTSSAVVAVFFPKVVLLAEEPSQLRGLLQRGLFWAGIPALGISVGYVAMPRLALQMVYGERYLAAAALVGPFGIAMFLYSLVSVLLAYHLALRRTRVAVGVVGFMVIEMALLSRQGANPPRVLSVLIAVMAGLLAYLVLHTWVHLRETEARAGRDSP